MAFKADQQRIDHMEALYRSGITLQAIGDEYGISRERVRQLLTKHRGIDRNFGGQRAVALGKAKDAHTLRIRKRDEHAQRLFGCSYDLAVEINGGCALWRKKNTVAIAYLDQKRNAGPRGIEWRFTLPEWWAVWLESGKFDQRGRAGYVMARHGDSGPYSPENVYICTAGQNFSDSYLVHPWAERFKASHAEKPGKGYAFMPDCNRVRPWQVLFYRNRVRYYGGYFATEQEAAACVAELWGQIAHG
jgi:hypothetical protein